MAKSIREVYGTVLAELGDTNQDIVVLDADLSGSTKTAIFKKAHPERFFNMGIAESDMVATAAGLSTTKHGGISSVPAYDDVVGSMR